MTISESRAALADVALRFSVMLATHWINDRAAEAMLHARREEVCSSAEDRSAAGGAREVHDTLAQAPAVSSTAMWGTRGATSPERRLDLTRPMYILVDTLEVA